MKKIEISKVHLVAGREYDKDNRPTKWAKADIIVSVYVGGSTHPYEVSYDFYLGTGTVYNETCDKVRFRCAAEVNEYLRATRVDFKHYEKSYSARA